MNHVRPQSNDSVGRDMRFRLLCASRRAVPLCVGYSGDTQLRAKVLGEGRAFEGEVHRAESIEEMKEYLRDEGNEEQVRFAIRTLWNRIEGRK